MEKIMSRKGLVNPMVWGVILVSGLTMALAGCIDEPRPASPPQEIPTQTETFMPPNLERANALRGFHEQCVKSFVDQPGFGMNRMGPLHRPGQFPKTITLPPESIGSESDTLAGQTFEVVSVELIGLVMHPEPLVYLNAPLKAPLYRPQTRPVNDFEKQSLPTINKENLLTIQADAKEIRMVGAINSQAKCINCHQDAKSETLGAFSYVLRPAVK
jgi:hypothetical protein